MDRKKTSDYMQIQSLGEWLERFLNPDLTYKEFENLIFDAVKLIHLDFGPLTSDKLIVALRNKEPGTPIWTDLKFLTNKNTFDAKDPEYKGIKDLVKKVMRAKAKEIGFSFYEDYPAKISHADTLSDTAKVTYDILDLMIQGWEASLVILQNILEARVPFIDYLDNSTKELFSHLARWHSSVVDIFEIGGDAFRQRRTIVYHGQIVRYPDIFPFHLIFARIFVDFLGLGGWNYYGFCKNCGKFFLVQRKGRKQFCSDHCRFQFHHPSKNTQHEKPLISVLQLLKR